VDTQLKEEHTEELIEEKLMMMRKRNSMSKNQRE